MATSVMSASPHSLPAKRPSPRHQNSRHVKRARLDYLLCDTGESSLYSIPLQPSPDDLVILPPSMDESPTDFDLPQSPSDQSTVYEPSTNPSVPTSPRSTTSAELLAAHIVDKFTKSRAVGQSHRDNEKEHVKSLRIDVAKCRDENVLLFALFSASYKLEHCRPLSYRLLSEVNTRLANDRPEDFKVFTDRHASNLGFIKLSNNSADLLEQRYMSPSFAVILLDFVTYRRNLVCVSLDVSEPGYRRRKRRSAYRVALSRSSANDIASFAITLFKREDCGDEEFAQYVDRRLGSLSVLLERWAEAEENIDPLEDLECDPDEVEYPPESPISPDAAEFSSSYRRRGEGAKRCSRCNMVKFTGSGHGRSKCDDGYSISSRVPYRPVPSSPGSECTDADATETSMLSNS